MSIPNNTDNPSKPATTASPANSVSLTGSTNSNATPRATVPGLFPRRSINLVVGTPKSGRLRLILPQLESYASGGPFFDYSLAKDQTPEQLGAIVCTQAFDSLWHQIRSLELEALSDPRGFPIEPWQPVQGAEAPTDAETLTEAYQRLTRAAGQPPRVLLIDGLQLMMTSGKINHMHAVREFYRGLQQFTMANDCTIIGTVSTAKMKNGESYTLNSRILGSVQWAENADTLIGVDVYDTEQPGRQPGGFRMVRVQTSNEAPRVFFAGFDGKGRLVLQSRPEGPAEIIAEDSLDALLKTHQPGTQFSRKDFIGWGEQLQISLRTVERWLASRLELGMLNKEGSTSRTVYLKPLEN